MSLLGVDVGFSRTRATTGVAWLHRGMLGLHVARSTWASRQRGLPNGAIFDVAAIDGPLVPRGTSPTAPRVCEAVFNQGPFRQRCKPSLSHHGTGLQLQKAASETAEQFAPFVKGADEPFPGALVCASANIVEAFPNAFLGVLLPESSHRAAPTLPRGRRFDWLYDQARGLRLFPQLTDRLNLPSAVRGALEGDRHHERRAALICLLTAACAATGTVTTVGDDAGGWLWLPPRELWASWAWDGLLQGRDRRLARGQSPLRIEEGRALLAIGDRHRLERVAREGNRRSS